MESFIDHDSPLAEFLEGTAVEGHQDPTPQSPDSSPDAIPVSFAPRGAPSSYSNYRQKFLDRRKSPRDAHISYTAELRRRCKHFISSRLVPDSSKFLERFRYILVTSQLLNDHATAQGFNPRLSIQNATANTATTELSRPSHTLLGVYATAGAAFIFAWSIHWFRSLMRERSIWWKIALLLLGSTILATIVYAAYVLQRRTTIQDRAAKRASSFVSGAQELDASTAGAIALIQEVELVSRGYKISSPLPPISRLEESGHVKRCERLRHALRRSVERLIAPYASAYNSFRDHAIEIDLERYNDIYEVSRMDIEEVETMAKGGTEEFSDPESLRSLKVSLQRLHTSRKLFLCCLLTIPFSNKADSVAVWSRIANTLHDLSEQSSAAAADLESILSEGSRATQPATPLKSPLSPGRERLKAQTRKFTVLGQGTRELQAKLYLLRDDCDRALAASSSDFDSGAVSTSLLEQYDTFGTDLKSLVQEWEDGRAALVAALDRQNDRRISLASSVGLTLSRSTTPSSPSAPATICGSPTQALKILNGDPLSLSETTSSDDEVFEAIALARPRSTLTREERIRKMQDERVKQAERREQADATRYMVKELESVIKLKPRPRPLGLKGRITSL